jgi:ATP-dependent Clp endopeptidase proteolytic subunit ClpP
MQKQIERQLKGRYEKFIKSRRAFDKDTWYSIQGKDTGVATVRIYDAIGMFGINAQEFAEDFDAITQDKVEVLLNCPGGSVWDGMAIYNTIRRHKAHVTTIVDGLAASMGSVIAMAGDHRLIHEGATMMIHEAWGIVIGPASDMRAEADVLDKISDQMAGIYEKNSALDKDDVRSAMAAETWYTAQEADEAGFADMVKDEKAPAEARAAAAMFDLSVFAHAPEDLCNPDPQSDSASVRRSIKLALRDAGLSRRQTEALMSSGFKAIQSEREAVADEVSAKLDNLINVLR